MNWQTIVQQNDLAVSSVNYSDLNKETRLDAEYHKPEAIRYLMLLEKKSEKTLIDVSKFVVGPFGSTVTVDNYVDDSNYYYVRNLDINSFEIKSPDAHIPKELYEKLKQFHIKQDDLLVTVVGTLGKVAIAQEKDTKSIFSCKSTIIRTNGVDPYFLAAFLNSSVGQTLLLRCKRGAVQEGLNLFDLKTLPVAIPTKDLQVKVRLLLTDAFIYSTRAVENYRQAEQLLLADLNLAHYTLSNTNTSTRNLSDCLVDDRFDAEYWQPKYDEIIAKVNSYYQGTSTIGDEFFQQKNNFKKENDKEYKYIEIGDINISTGEVDYSLIIGSELPANAKIRLGNRQLITSKVRPNRGATAILTNHNGFIGSGAFTVLTEKGKINLETLMVYLKTEPIRELLQRYNTGTSYPVITDNDVLQLPMPQVQESLQQKIAQLISSFVEKRELAKNLLEKAKRAVEVYVEQDESQALKFLD